MQTTIDFRAASVPTRPTHSRSQDSLTKMTSSRERANPATGNDLRTRFKAIQQQSRATARADDVTTSLSESVAGLKKYLPRSDSLFGAVGRRAPMRVPRDAQAEEVMTSSREESDVTCKDCANVRMQRSSSLETLTTSAQKSDSEDSFATSARTGR